MQSPNSDENYVKFTVENTTITYVFLGEKKKSMKIGDSKECTNILFHEIPSR